jgi:PIN domain nuclease of toxin-antitoxin system
MKYLLDTQILIWSLEDNPKLKKSLLAIIENPLNTILVSQFTLMEMSIKLKLGKLPEFAISIEYITKQLLLDGFELLQVSDNHIFSYQSITFFEDHRDPFDRFLLATALSEQLPIISADKKFLLYRPLITVID